MSILTARSALVLQLAQLDATECARCGHPLKQHIPSLHSDGCTEWHMSTGGNPNNSHQVFCKCKRFVDRAEQLGLGEEPQ